MKHWYDSCVGTIFATYKMLTFEEMDCEQCGDSDYYIGMYETEEEAIRALNEALEESE